MAARSSFVFRVMFSRDFDIIIPLADLITPFEVRSSRVVFGSPPMLLAEALLPNIVVLQLEVLASIMILLASVLSGTLRDSALGDTVLT